LRYTSTMFPNLSQALSWFSRVCGFETLSCFPEGHVHQHTHWHPAYFDIASDLKPDQIEAQLCEKIANTPTIFAHITNPTPRMQRELLTMIESTLRRSGSAPATLVGLLINAYRSPHTIEALPGLRRAIEESGGNVIAVINFLGAMPAAFDVIEA